MQQCQLKSSEDIARRMFQFPFGSALGFDECAQVTRQDHNVADFAESVLPDTVQSVAQTNDTLFSGGESEKRVHEECLSCS